MSEKVMQVLAEWKTSATNWVTEQDKKLLAAIGVTFTVALVGGVFYYRFYTRETPSTKPRPDIRDGGESGRLAQNSNNPTTNSSQTSVVEDEPNPILKLKKQGNALFAKKKYEEAAEKYTLALRQCDKNDSTNKSILYQNRAAANECLEKWLEVIGDCTEAIVHNRYYSKAYGRRGKAYFKIKRNDDAFRDGLFCMAINHRDKKSTSADIQRITDAAGMASSREQAEVIHKTRQIIVPTEYEFKTIFRTYYNDPLYESVETSSKLPQDERSPYQQACYELLINKNFTLIPQLCADEISRTESPFIVFSYLLRGTYHFLAADPPAALQDFQAVLNMPEVSDRIKSTVHLRRATVLTQMGDESVLMKEYGEAIKLDPDNPDAYNQRSNFYMLTENVMQAIPDAQKAVELAPECLTYQIVDLGIEFNKAVRSGSSFGLEAIIDKFKKFTTDHPTEPQGWILLSKGLRLMQKNEEALKCLEPAIGQLEDCFQTPLYCEMGEIYCQMAQKDKCLETYLKGYELDSKNQELLSSLANAYVQYRMADEAIKIFDELVALVKTELELYQACHLRQSSLIQSLIKKILGIETDNYVRMKMMEEQGFLMG